MTKDIKTAICIPGGGVRGIVSAINIARYEKEKKLDLENVDLFSGTSTGSIIAAALALPKPFSPDELVEMYTDLAPKLFALSWYQPKWAMRLMYGAPYDTHKLRDILNVNFGSARLGDVKRNLSITTVSVDEQIPHDLNGTTLFQRGSKTMFVSNVTPPSEHWLEVPLADIVTASCAAPSYFNPHRFRVKTGANSSRWVKCIDGGLADNTGIVGASLAAQKVKQDHQMQIYYFANGGRKWCGDSSIKPESVWQLKATFQKIISTIIPSNETMVRQAAETLLGDNFNAIEPFSNDNIGLDEYEKMDELIRIAKNKELYND